ncbi:MAG: LacI family DNA-binding transcriptional regulator [Lachnospiraceae bacterium]|nr:LacI family DNA-binding transcriptional regulator [Lachnospiraceae bacterium]
MNQSGDKINIREIARLAGVSTATVSRALRTPEKLQEETLQKVLKVIEETSYSPRTSSPYSNVICVIMDSPKNMFYCDILHYLTSFATEKNYFVAVFYTNGRQDLEQNLYQYCKSINCAGIILTSFSQLNSISSAIPTVLLDGPHAATGNFYRISSDNESAIRMLVDHMVRLNHQKIGFISAEKHCIAGKERREVFCNYMNSLGLDIPDEYIYMGDYSISSGLGAFDHFYALPNMPTAILSSNDEMAKGFIIRANVLGVRIPEDISICGIDAVDNDSFIPKITSIHQDTKAIAEEAFEYIFYHQEREFAGTKILPVSFSPGNTCYRI